MDIERLRQIGFRKELVAQLNNQTSRLVTLANSLEPEFLEDTVNDSMVKKAIKDSTETINSLISNL